MSVFIFFIVLIIVWFTFLLVPWCSDIGRKLIKYLKDDNTVKTNQKENDKNE